MQCVLVLIFRRQAEVQDSCHHLPYNLHQANYTEIPISLQYQDDGLPGALLREVNLPEVSLD